MVDGTLKKAVQKELANILKLRMMLLKKVEKLVKIRVRNFIFMGKTDKYKQRIAMEMTPILQKGSNKSTRSKMTIQSVIVSDFKGWAGNTLFELQNGQIWKQSQY